MRARRALLVLGLLLGVGCAESLPERPHILFISIDDLLPRLGCYGSSDAKTPNLDHLASQGVLFQRAYAQYAQCGPSRASVLTGLLPERCGVIRNDVHYRETIGDQVVLPQLFREAGWRTLAMGKVHHGLGEMDDPVAWSEAPWRPERWQRWYPSEEAREAQAAAEALVPEELRYAVRSRVEDHAAVPAAEFPDAQLADEAIRVISEHGEGGGREGEPLFLALGFLKPHLPFVSPQEYWDMHQGTNRVLQGQAPDDAPPVALHSSPEVRAFLDVPAEGAFSAELSSRLVRGYRACTSFVDAQVGRVLDCLEERGLAEETIVVVWGDHGWHFNELGVWGKHTNFEQALRVPLILRARGIDSREFASFTELVDLYPTLAGLAGLDAPVALDGRDLSAALLKGEDASVALAPRSQCLHGSVMGRTVRDETGRYTEWELADEVVATELYASLPAVNEERNLSGEEPARSDLARMRALLGDRFQR